MNWAGKRYWLVGASEGLGRALAEKLSAKGAELILTARSEDRLQDLADSLDGPAQVLAADISSDDSMKAAGQRLGHVDGVVFLAGVYWPMNATKWDGEQAKAMANINFTGAFRVLDQVMPQFIERGTGHILITGSLSGFRGLPNAVGYSASKAGVMALAESMFADLRTTDIRVQVANPGFIKTRLTDKNEFNMPFIMTPEKAAQVLFDHMNHGGFKISFPTAFSLLFRFSQFWPDWLYYRIFKP
ncbi:MAG: SDR family NAD(P)-dependent oxidoreductase [Pseudomonadota bacterium]